MKIIEKVSLRATDNHNPAISSVPVSHERSSLIDGNPKSFENKSIPSKPIASNPSSENELGSELGCVEADGGADGTGVVDVELIVGGLLAPAVEPEVVVGP